MLIFRKKDYFFNSFKIFGPFLSFPSLGDIMPIGQSKNLEYATNIMVS